MAAERKVGRRAATEPVRAPATPPIEANGGSEAETPDRHPLEDLLGKYEGEAWEAVLEAIRLNRERDRAELDEVA